MIFHGNRLLALHEGDKPYVVRLSSNHDQPIQLGTAGSSPLHQLQVAQLLCSLA